MECPKCGNLYDDSSESCPFCGLGNPSLLSKDAEGPKPRTPENLRRERIIYVSLTVVPYVVGIALVFTLSPPLRSSIPLIMLFIMAYATSRFGRYLELDRREWLIAIILFLLLYVGSFVYLLYKSFKKGAVLEGEPEKIPSAPAEEAPVEAPPVGPIKGLSRKWKIWIPILAAAAIAIVLAIVLAVVLPSHEKKPEEKSKVTRKVVKVKKTVEQPPHLSSVFALDASHVWAVGDGGTVIFFDGSSWSKQESGTSFGLNSVTAADPEHVWAVGESGKIVFFNGTGWSLQDSPGSNEELNDVDALDAEHVWSVGSKGTVLFFDGNSWTSQTSGTTQELTGVSAVDPAHVWAVGSVDTVLSFDGASWSQLPIEITYNFSHLESVSALDTSHVWAVGWKPEIIFYDGANWTTQPIPVVSAYASEPYYRYVEALDVNHIWVATDEGPLLFSDGASWVKQEADVEVVLQCISALDGNHAWAVGGLGTVLFFDGSSWSKVDTGIWPGR